jgi:hypothetical protein
MKKTSTINISQNDLDRCLAEVELVDNVMCHPCSLFFLDRRNRRIINEIEPLLFPTEITTMLLRILPTDMSKFYYSLNGIETIIYNLLRNDVKPFEKDIKRGDVYLKVYYEKDELFTVPVICIEMIFMKKLHPKSIDRLWMKLQSEIVLFTSSVGDIENVELKTLNDLENLFYVPLYVGCPEFKMEGLLRRKRFNEEQVEEMNYIHGISPLKLDMDYVVNNSRVALFDDIRDAIKRTQREKIQNQEDVHDYIITLFPQDDIDELPF